MLITNVYTQITVHAAVYKRQWSLLLTILYTTTEFSPVSELLLFYSRVRCHIKYHTLGSEGFI